MHSDNLVTDYRPPDAKDDDDGGDDRSCFVALYGGIFHGSLMFIGNDKRYVTIDAVSRDPDGRIGRAMCSVKYERVIDDGGLSFACVEMLTRYTLT